MTDVYWYGGFRGMWDHGLLLDIFNSEPDIFRQNNSEVQIVYDRAIIIMGKPNDPKQVREHLKKFKSGTVILTSDEDSLFDYRAAIPEQFDIWTQYHSPNKEDIRTRLLLGYTTRFREAKKEPQERKYLWSFVGQVQNQHRKKCMDTCISLLKDSEGYLKIADGFGGYGGLANQEYIDIMLQSKVVFCPSGSMCTDSFRVYEALECGCLPIVEPRAPRDPEGWNYWREVGANMFTMVHDWEDVRDIIFDEQKVKELTDISQQYWKQYKTELKNKLLAC